MRTKNANWVWNGFSPGDWEGPVREICPIIIRTVGEFFRYTYRFMDRFFELLEGKAERVYMSRSRVLTNLEEGMLGNCIRWCKDGINIICRPLRVSGPSCCNYQVPSTTALRDGLFCRVVNQLDSRLVCNMSISCYLSELPWPESIIRWVYVRRWIGQGRASKVDPDSTEYIYDLHKPQNCRFLPCARPIEITNPMVASTMPT